jgi:lipid-A-disaccharide synthase
MKYYIIAGEASGDLHGSNLIKGLKKSDPEAHFRVWGGDLMQQAGGELVRHYKETAVMGFVEVLMHASKIKKNFDLCKKDLVEYNPDVLILIDYPGFNFRMAKYAKDRGIKVFYYISPKVWAWKEGRIKNLKRDVDKLFIIFPFEVEYFKKHGIEAEYNGNPLLDSTDAHPCNLESREEFILRNNLDNRPIIGLLAGSRKTEISYLLPRIKNLIHHFPDHQFILAAAPSIEPSYYQEILKDSNLKVLFGETYSVLKHSAAAVISSGTASLEAALLNTPQVVCYGGNEISYQIAKRFVKVKYISLVNLILDAPAVKELIQHDCTQENIITELKDLLTDKRRKQVAKYYKKLRELLGGEGASEKTAKAMMTCLMKMKNETCDSVCINSPVGLLRISCSEKEITEIANVGEDRPSEIAEPGKISNPLLNRAAVQLQEYFEEKREAFDLPLKFGGTDFQNRVWRELTQIPYGKSKTYGEIASLVNSKDAVRAVGMACKMNPLLIVVPCHRVIGAHNKLTGFNLGIDKKIFLLNLEKTYIHTDINIFSNEDQGQ